MRGEIRQIGGLTLILDCYNANPQSLRAALDLLVEIEPGRPKVAVLGSMLELGARSEELHTVLSWARRPRSGWISSSPPASSLGSLQTGRTIISVVDPLEAYEKTPRKARRRRNPVLMKGVERSGIGAADSPVRGRLRRIGTEVQRRRIGGRFRRSRGLMLYHLLPDLADVHDLLQSLPLYHVPGRRSARDFVGAGLRTGPDDHPPASSGSASDKSFVRRGRRRIFPRPGRRRWAGP